MTFEANTTIAQAAAGASYTAGRVLAAPAIAGTLEAPEVQAAVKRIAWQTGFALGTCIALGMAVGFCFRPSK